ncbi:MAG: glycosyltransferase family 9 protein [Alphaproteobacteria bacterium]
MPSPARILVIKHSAFGDFILSTGSFKAIRAHHPDAHITLMTTASYGPLGEACPFFDDVWVDPRPSLRTPLTWLSHVGQLRGAGFQRVYDLQRNDRTAGYFRALWPQPPEWVGVARGCSHRYRKPADRKLHIVDREVAQLALAGVAAEPMPDLSWLGIDTSPPHVPMPMVLLVPGSARHRAEKRWPAAAYGRLAAGLAAAGLTPVLIGGPDEADARAGIAAACPAAVDLGGRTDMPQIAALARRAVAAVGNDTGPMHVAAAVGCPSVSLFGPASDPALIGPRGPRVTILRADPIGAIEEATVRAALDHWLGESPATDLNAAHHG